MTKTFSRIPANVPVMLDANIVIYALFPQVSQYDFCKKLLEQGARGELQHLATNDANFERVPGITVRTPG